MPNKPKLATAIAGESGQPTRPDIFLEPRGYYGFAPEYTIYPGTLGDAPRNKEEEYKEKAQSYPTSSSVHFMESDTPIEQRIGDVKLDNETFWRNAAQLSSDINDVYGAVAKEFSDRGMDINTAYNGRHAWPQTILEQEDIRGYASDGLVNNDPTQPLHFIHMSAHNDRPDVEDGVARLSGYIPMYAQVYNSGLPDKTYTHELAHVYQSMFPEDIGAQNPDPDILARSQLVSDKIIPEQLRKTGGRLGYYFADAGETPYRARVEPHADQFGAALSLGTVGEPSRRVAQGRMDTVDRATGGFSGIAEQLMNRRRTGERRGRLTGEETDRLDAAAHTAYRQAEDVSAGEVARMNTSALNQMREQIFDELKSTQNFREAKALYDTAVSLYEQYKRNPTPGNRDAYLKANGEYMKFKNLHEKR